MALDNIEYKTDGYGTVSKSYNAAIRAIKLQEKSNANIDAVYDNEIRKSIEVHERANDYTRGQVDGLKSITQSKINEEIASGADMKVVEDHTLHYATKLAQLEKTITIVPEEKGPIDIYKNRAIKLKEEMMENAVNNSYGLRKEKANDGMKTIEKIAEENKSGVVADINKAIDEQSIDELFAAHLAKVKAEEELANIETDDEIVNVISDSSYPEIVPSFTSNSEMIQEVNKKVDEQEKEENNVESINENSLDVFKPKTEEEIAEFRNNAMIDAHNEYKSEEQNNEAIRDDVVVIADRDENVETKEIEEYVTVEKELDENKVELGKEIPEFAPAKEIVVSGDVKEKFKDDYAEKYKGLSYEEVLEKLNAQSSRKSELTKELKDAEQKQEEVIKINSEVIEEEENIEKAEEAAAEEEANIEKKNAELKAEDERKKKELYDLALNNLIAMEKKNAELVTTIGVVNEKSASVKENTEARRENIINKRKSVETRRENITNINKDNEQLKESIESKDKEIQMMLGESYESSDDYEKVK